MEPRLNHAEFSPDSLKRLTDLSLLKTSLDPVIKHLVDIRASQLNGCTFCLDMHIKEAKIAKESELRLHHIASWRESRLFSAKEKAALEWTELVTNITPKGITDDEYHRALEVFSEKELSDLTYQIGIINTWNRLNVAFQLPHGVLDKMYGLDKAGLE